MITNALSRPDPSVVVALIPDSIADQIREVARRHLVDLISETVTLQRKGGLFKACCPLPGHDDSSPSFEVNPRKEKWFCNPCGASGDYFRYMQLRFGRPFGDVAREIADRYGIQIPDPEQERKPLTAAEMQERKIQGLLARVVEVASQGGEPIASLDGTPISGVLPPLKELIAGLRALGFKDEDLRSVGLTASLRSHASWVEGGPAVWARSRRGVSAIRPLTRDRVPVIGPSGARSWGWVGAESARRNARMEGVVHIAADPDAFIRLRSLGEQAALMPIGALGVEAIEQVILPEIEPIILASPDPDSRARALRLAMHVLPVAPRLGVAEIADATDANAFSRALGEALDQAGTVFEWQASLLHSRGTLRTEEGRRKAATHLARIIEVMPAEVGGLERDICASMLERITGIGLEEALGSSVANKTVTTEEGSEAPRVRVG